MHPWKCYKKLWFWCPMKKTLIKEIEEEEIISAIWGLEPDKDPSQDMFSIHFTTHVGI